MLQPLFQTTSLGGNLQISMPLTTLVSIVDLLKTSVREERMDGHPRLPVMRLIVEQALKVGLPARSRIVGHTRMTLVG